MTVTPEAGDRWVAELVDEGEVRTFRGSREDVLVWGLVQMPLEAVVRDPVRGERSFAGWVREVKAEVGPTRPDGADVPGAVIAEMYVGGEPAGGVGERGRGSAPAPRPGVR